MSCDKAGFPRGTTPPLEFEVMHADLTGWDIYLTFKSAGATVTKETDDLTIEYDTEHQSTVIKAHLTQADTLALSAGLCEAQIRAVKDGEAIATEVVSVQVSRILMDGVIPIVPEPVETGTTGETAETGETGTTEVGDG